MKAIITSILTLTFCYVFSQAQGGAVIFNDNTGQQNEDDAIRNYNNQVAQRQIQQQNQDRQFEQQMRQQLQKQSSELTIPYQGIKLGWTQDDIIKRRGTDFKAAFSFNNTLYYAYTNQVYSTEYGWYSLYDNYYFDAHNICVQIVMSAPIATANSWIRILNSKFISTGELTWKDYATGEIVVVTLKDPIIGMSFKPQ